MSVFYKVPVIIWFTLTFSVSTNTESLYHSNHSWKPAEKLYQSAHSHNDYLHPNPLYDALANGFGSIEVDIHLIDDQLYVSHLTPLILDEQKTLKNLYLQPLFDLYQSTPDFFQHQEESPLLTLMVDIKTDKNSTYEKLKKEILPYQEMFCSWTNHKLNMRAVRLLLSGNRPIEKVLTETHRFVQIDGRIEDINENYPNSFMPIISDNYSKICKKQWFGKSPNKANLKKIEEVAKAVHQSGKEFRLWNIFDNELSWQKIRNAGVDIVNTDDLSGLAFFLKEENLYLLTTR